jgi:hypothetical protein
VGYVMYACWLLMLSFDPGRQLWLALLSTK